MRIRSALAALSAAAALAVAATLAQLWREEARAWSPSTAAHTVALRSFTVDPHWVREGQPRFSTAEIARTPDGRSLTGVWACEGRTTFEWHFDLDESVYVLEGRVEISYQGRHFVLEPGQSAVFKAGTKALWHVPSHLKKVFKLHDPGRLARLWRGWRQAQS